MEQHLSECALASFSLGYPGGGHEDGLERGTGVLSSPVPFSSDHLRPHIQKLSPLLGTEEVGEKGARQPRGRSEKGNNSVLPPPG